MSKVLLVVHPTRVDAQTYADTLNAALVDAGFEVSRESAEGAEIAVVLGGDGTILRAAQLCRDTHVPILGINLGSVGFMAEIKKPTIAEIVEAIKSKSYKSEARLVVRYVVTRAGVETSSGWALNEVVIEGLPGLERPCDRRRPPPAHGRRAVHGFRDRLPDLETHGGVRFGPGSGLGGR